MEEVFADGVFNTGRLFVLYAVSVRARSQVAVGERGLISQGFRSWLERFEGYWLQKGDDEGLRRVRILSRSWHRGERGAGGARRDRG